MKRVLTVGGATEDIFLEYKKIEMLNFSTEFEKRAFIILEEGRKIEVDNLKYFTGGGATNSAVSFVKLGFDAAPFCKIGADLKSQFVLEQLLSYKVSTDSVVLDKDYATGMSFIIPAASGGRTALVFRGANLYLNEKEIPISGLKDTDLVYITSLTGNSSKLFPIVARHAKKHGCYVAANPGSSQLRAGAKLIEKALGNIDIFILNSDEAKECMAALVCDDLGLQKKLLDVKPCKDDSNLPELLSCPLVHRGICFSLQNYFKAILDRGPEIVVVTNGAEGVYVGTKDGILFHPSLSVPIVNTLGAGDAFSSCFVASIVRGMNLEDSLRAGIINASSVIGHLDTKTGLLDLDQLSVKLVKIDLKLLQKF